MKSFSDKENIVIIGDLGYNYCLETADYVVKIK